MEIVDKVVDHLGNRLSNDRDPLEGSVVILVGSALVALGTFLGQSERHLVRYRTLSFILISAGVGAMFGSSAVWGFGGSSGLSMWWGLSNATREVANGFSQFTN